MNGRSINTCWSSFKDSSVTNSCSVRAIVEESWYHYQESIFMEYDNYDNVVFDDTTFEEEESSKVYVKVDEGDVFDPYDVPF